MPRFTDLIDKIGRNEPLSAAELSELRQQGEAIDEVVSLVKSWITTGTSAPFIQNLRAENIFVPSGEIRLGTPAPGQGFSGVRIAEPAILYNGELWNIVGINDDALQVGIRASDGKLVFGGGDGHLDEFGLTFQNQEGLIQFLDTDGGGTMVIYGDGGNNLTLENSYGGRGIAIVVDSDAHEVLAVEIEEDESQSERTMIDIQPGDNGGRLGVAGKVFIDGEGGAGGGLTAITMSESTNSPGGVTQDTQGRIYFRDNKFIIQWNDGGTERFKYLDLTGTGDTWTHTTSAP